MSKDLLVRLTTVEVPGEALSSVMYRATMMRQQAHMEDRVFWDVTSERSETEGDLFTITIRGPIPKIRGHEVFGTFTITDGVTPISGIPESTVPLFENPAECAICGTRRASTHYLLRDPFGATFAIGARCLETYLSYPKRAYPSMQTQLADAISDPAVRLLDTARKVEKSRHHDTNTVVAVALYLHKRDGYASRDRAQRTGMASTADYMRSMLDGYADGGYELPPEIANLALAAAVMRAWGLEDMTTDSDFTVRLRDALNRPTVTHHAFGLIAALPATYSRHARIEDALAAGDPIPGENYTNEPVGVLGQRLTLNVIVEELRLLDSGSWLVGMRGPEGHRLTWFASTTPRIHNREVTRGQHIRITGTVKDHSEFRGRIDTRLNRCLIAHQ